MPACRRGRKRVILPCIPIVATALKYRPLDTRHRN
jgi:hypothetical protein